MRIYPQFILWTYLILPAICLFLTPGFLAGLVKAQLQKAKIMSNVMNTRAKAAAAIARSHAKSLKKRYLPEHKISRGMGQKFFHSRTRRDVDVDMDMNTEQQQNSDIFKRNSHWDQQEESMGQLQNMWNMNNFANMQNGGILRESHSEMEPPHFEGKSADADPTKKHKHHHHGKKGHHFRSSENGNQMVNGDESLLPSFEEFKPNGDMVGIPRIYDNAKYGDGPNSYYTGPFFGRNVYDEVIAQANPLVNELNEHEMMGPPFERSPNKGKEHEMVPYPYYPQSYYGSYYPSYYRSNDDQLEPLEVPEFQMISQQPPDFMEPKSANPHPHHHKKHKTHSGGYYSSSGYYGRNNENEDIIGAVNENLPQQMIPSHPNGMDANTSPINKEIENQQTPNFMETKSANPDPHHHHHHPKKYKTYSGGYYPSSGYYGRNNENEETIGAANVNVPQEMMPKEPNVMDANTSPINQETENQQTPNFMETKSANPDPHHHHHKKYKTYSDGSYSSSGYYGRNNENEDTIGAANVNVPQEMMPKEPNVMGANTSPTNKEIQNMQKTQRSMHDHHNHDHSHDDVVGCELEEDLYGKKHGDDDLFNPSTFYQRAVDEVAEINKKISEAASKLPPLHLPSIPEINPLQPQVAFTSSEENDADVGATHNTKEIEPKSANPNPHLSSHGFSHTHTFTHSHEKTFGKTKGLHASPIIVTPAGHVSPGFSTSTAEAHAKSKTFSHGGANEHIGGFGQSGLAHSGSDALAAAQSGKQHGYGQSAAQANAQSNSQNFNHGGFGVSGGQSSALANAAAIQQFNGGSGLSPLAINNGAAQANAQANSQNFNQGGYGVSGGQSSALANAAATQQFNGESGLSPLAINNVAVQANVQANSQHFNEGGYGISGGQSSALANAATQQFNSGASQANAQADSQSYNRGGFGISGGQSSASANAATHSAPLQFNNGGGYGQAEAQNWNAGGFGQTASQANAQAASQAFNSGGFGQSSAQTAPLGKHVSDAGQFFQVFAPSNFGSARSQDGAVGQPMEAGGFVMPHIDEIPVRELMHEMEGEMDRFPRSQDPKQDLFGGLNLASSIVRSSLNGGQIPQDNSADAQNPMSFVTDIVDSSLKAGNPSNMNGFNNDQIEEDSFTNPRYSNQNVLGGPNLVWSIERSSLSKNPLDEPSDDQKRMSFISDMVDSSLKARNAKKDALETERDAEESEIHKASPTIPRFTLDSDQNTEQMSTDDLENGTILGSTLDKNQTEEQTVADDLKTDIKMDPDDPKFREELKKEIMAFINDQDLRQRGLMNMNKKQPEKDQIRRTKDLRQDLVGIINLPSTIVRSNLENLENNPLLHLNRGAISADQAADAQKTMNFVTDIVDSSLKIGQQADQHENAHHNENLSQNDRNTDSRDPAADTQKTMGFVTDIVDSSLKVGQQANQHKNAHHEPADENSHVRNADSLETARDATFQGISSISGIVNDGLRLKRQTRDLRQDLVGILNLPSAIVRSNLGNGGAISGDQAADASKTMSFVTDIVDSSLKIGQQANQHHNAHHESADENLNQNGNFRNADLLDADEAANNQKTMRFVTGIVDSSLKVEEHKNAHHEPANENSHLRNADSHMVDDGLRHKRQTMDMHPNQEETVGKHGSDSLLHTSSETVENVTTPKKQKKGKMMNPDEMYTTEYVTIEPWASNWDYVNNREKWPHEIKPVTPKLEEKHGSDSLLHTSTETVGNVPNPKKQKKGKMMNPDEMYTTEYVTIEPWASNWDYVNNREKWPHEIKPVTPKPEEKSDDLKVTTVKQPEEGLFKILDNSDSMVDAGQAQQDKIVGSQSNWKPPGSKSKNQVKEFSKFDKVANEKIESDADIHAEKLGASDPESKAKQDPTSSSEEDGPKTEIEPNKPISTLTLDEIEDIQFREPFNATNMPENQGDNIPVFAPAVEENANDNNNQPSEDATQKPAASTLEMEDHNVNQTIIDTSTASSEPGSNKTSASDSFLDKDEDAKGIGTANEEPVLGMNLNKTKIFTFSMLGISPNQSGFIFNASGGPFDSIESEMRILTPEEKESFIKQEMALISEVIEETLKKDDFWGRDLKKNETKEPKDDQDQVVSSPNLFRAVEQPKLERDARSAANPEELDAILGAHREKLEDIHKDAIDDGDLLMISFIGDGILKDLEQRRDKVLQTSGTEKSVVTELAESASATKRTKRKIAGLNPSYIPITRLVSDPTTKIDVPKTLENVGAVVRHTFENPRAPMYHVRSMLGNTKNTVMSAANIPPNNILIPSQYEIAKTTGHEDRTLGAINQQMLNSRSGGDNMEKAVEGDSLGVMDTFHKIGDIVRESVQSGKDVVLHVTDAATDARNVLYTAKHAAPRLLIPGQIPIVVSRVSDVDSRNLGKKAVLIAPRILDINENVVGAEAQQPDQFVGMGHILDAVGFTKPNPPEVDLRKIVLDPTTIEMRQWVKDMKDSLKAPNNVEETLESLREAEQSVGAKNLKDFFSKMHQEMKEILTSQHEERKRKRIETVENFKSRSSLKKDQKIEKKKPKRKTQAPIEDIIQKPDAIVGTTNAKINYDKIIDEHTDATLPPEVLKIFIGDIPSSTKQNSNCPCMNSRIQNHHVEQPFPTINSKFVDEHDATRPPEVLKVFTDDTNEPQKLFQHFPSPSSDAQDETVGLYLAPELMKPFMGQPSEDQFNTYMRENGDDEVTFERESSKQPTVYPVHPLNLNLTIPMNGMNLSALLPVLLRPALVGEPNPTTLGSGMCQKSNPLSKIQHREDFGHVLGALTPRMHNRHVEHEPFPTRKTIEKPIQTSDIINTKFIDAHDATLPPEVLKVFTDDIPNSNSPNEPRMSGMPQKSNPLSEMQHREDLGHVLGAINPMMFERHFNESLRRNPAGSRAARHRGADEILGDTNEDTIIQSTKQVSDVLTNQQVHASNDQDERRNMKQNNFEEHDTNPQNQTGRTSMTISDRYQQPFMGSISHDRVHEFLNQYNNNLPENGEEPQWQENPNPVKNVVFSDDEDYDDFLI